MRICRIMSHITKIRFWFSLRDHKDLDVHDAHSAQIRLAVTLEIDLLCRIILLQSSCISLSQCISQIKCWKKRWHWIVFDRTATLFSERISNCTNTLYSGEFSKVFLYTAILGLSRSYWTSSWFWWGSRLWRTWTAFSSWDFLPPKINPHWMMECMSWAFPTWWTYSAKSSGNDTLSCNVRSTRVPPESPWIARKCKICSAELGSSNAETFAFVLLLLPRSLSKHELANAK